MSGLILRLRHLPLDKAKMLTGPVEEPLLLEQVTAHLRIDSAEEVPQLMAWITGARQMAETYTHRALITQTWQLFFDTVPTPGMDEWWDGVRQGPIRMGQAGSIELPHPPLQSVVAVTVYDSADQPTVWPADNYYTDTASDPGRICLRDQGQWPQPMRTVNGLEIQFVCGYGLTGAEVPQPILNGMLLVIGHLYENREATTEAPLSEIPLGATTLWDPYRVVR
jgi:uncharacterized phiE125 gp8 family phage protein